MTNKPEQEALPPVERYEPEQYHQEQSMVMVSANDYDELASQLAEALSSLAKAEEQVSFTQNLSDAAHDKAWQMQLRAEKAEQERDEALEFRNLSVAGTVRDSSYPSGWRNFRAEKAEERNRDLEADAERDLRIITEIITTLDGSHISERILDKKHSIFLTTPARVRGLREHAEAAESELSKLREENRWISVDDGLQPVKKDVLVICRDGQQHVASFHPDCTCDGKWHGARNPTHWRPLPSGPVDAKKEG